MHCFFDQQVGLQNERQKQRQAAGVYQRELEVTDMANDDRDILEVLKEELDFIEKGGYGRSVRTPWKPKSVFQDSLTCINYGYPYRAHPCNECHLLEFVDQEHKFEAIPCHHIALDEAGGNSRRFGKRGRSGEVRAKGQRLAPFPDWGNRGATRDTGNCLSRQKRSKITPRLVL